MTLQEMMALVPVNQVTSPHENPYTEEDYENVKHIIDSGFLTDEKIIKTLEKVLQHINDELTRGI